MAIWPISQHLEINKKRTKTSLILQGLALYRGIYARCCLMWCMALIKEEEAEEKKFAFIHTFMYWVSPWTHLNTSKTFCHILSGTIILACDSLSQDVAAACLWTQLTHKLGSQATVPPTRLLHYCTNVSHNQESWRLSQTLKGNKKLLSTARF